MREQNMLGADAPQRQPRFDEAYRQLEKALERSGKIVDSLRLMIDRFLGASAALPVNQSSKLALAKTEDGKLWQLENAIENLHDRLTYIEIECTRLEQELGD